MALNEDAERAERMIAVLAQRAISKMQKQMGAERMISVLAGRPQSEWFVQCLFRLGGWVRVFEFCVE